MKPEPRLQPRLHPQPRRRGIPMLLRTVTAAALLSLALVPAWGVRHIRLDDAGGDLLPAPKLLLSAVHL